MGRWRRDDTSMNRNGARIRQVAVSLGRKLRIGALAAASVLTAWAQARYHAKLATEDGSSLPTAPQIIPDQSVRLVQSCWILNTFGNGTVEYAVNWRSRPYDPQTADACPVTIRIAGFKQASVTLRDGGTVVLKRVGDHEGSTISASSLNAPPDAHKAWDKGVEAMSQRKWAAAQKHFERAVAIYPAYAAAWSDLGEVLLAQSKPDEARAGYQHAIEADPKYIKPYLQLARMDLQEKRNDDALAITDSAIKQNPLEFPGVYFYNAVANFNLKRLDVAEKSARRAVELDSTHEIPRAEDLLGTILAHEGDRAGAVEHMKKYLALSPNAQDADQVKQHIAMLEGAPVSEAK